MEWDLLEAFDLDVAIKIFECLDHPADIVRASAVSRSWRHFLIANGICKHLCVKLFPQLSGIAHVVDVTSTEEKFVDVGFSSDSELQHLKNEHRAYASLARWLTSSEVAECHLHAVSASSTDNYFAENVRNTLEPRVRIGFRTSYWSSTGQSNPEVPERLTYKLTSDLCVITEINVRPFEAFFQENSPIYSAKAVRFHMRDRIFPGDRDFTCNESLQSAREKFVWTYTSPEFPMLQENSLQNFKLPKPVLCIGGMLQIELIGRVQRQEMDDLFYICVAYVQVIGRSLFPIFGIDSIEPSGKFTLLYNPQAELSTSPSAHEETYDITATIPMYEMQVRNLDEIFRMFNVVAEAYDFEEEEAYIAEGLVL